jgi:creatinine amidohydrolase
MRPTSGIRIERLTWPEVQRWLDDEVPVVLPIGARCKEHGLHLPMNNDWLLAEYLLDRILEKRRVAALPTVPYGFYPAFIDYPGSVNIARDTFADTVVDIGRSIQRHGARCLYVLNTGVSTNWALEPARLRLGECGLLMDYTDILSVLAPVERELMEQSAGTHADEIETSMMLYIAPDVVRMDRAQPDLPAKPGRGPFTRDPDRPGHYSPTGAWGDPTLATEAKGRRVIETLVAALIAEIDALAAADFVPVPPRECYL